MDHIWLLHYRAPVAKTKNFKLYTHSLYKIADMFFSFDGQNYLRFLTFISVFLEMANYVDITFAHADMLSESSCQAQEE